MYAASPIKPTKTARPVYEVSSSIDGAVDGAVEEYFLTVFFHCLFGGGEVVLQVR